MRSYATICICVAASCLTVLGALCASACDEEPPPIVIIESVRQGAEVGGNTDLVATIQNCNKSVTAVVFLVDGDVVAFDDAADAKGRYVSEWDTRESPDGEHQLSAAVLISDGRVTNSEIVEVIVSNESWGAVD